LTDTRLLGDPGTPAFQVRKYPFFQLNRLVGRYNIVVAERLRAIDVDIPTWRVLMILGESSPRGIGEIAQFAIIRISTLTRIIQRMTAAGLVAGERRDGDNRVTEISLTALGRERLADARVLTAPIYAQVIAGLSQRDFDRLTDLLDRLHANLAGDEPV